MKDFLKRYSYAAVHLYVTQVVIGLFGLVLALAAGKADNDVLKLVTSVFAIVFFLFLEFSAAWRVGAEDRMTIDTHKIKPDYWVPVKIWLLASSVNFLLAFLITLGLFLPDIAFFSGMGAIATIIKYITEGMYTGVLAQYVAGVQLNTLWFVHFLTSIPALFAIYGAYFCGLKNISFGGMFSPNGSMKK